MRRAYWMLENMSMMSGIDPQMGQVEAGTFVPTLDLLTESEAATQAGGTPSPELNAPQTPGAVPVRPERWTLDAEPFALYRLASGDTFVGLAATYLGSGSRWREIWNVQTDSFRQSHSPDVIFVEEVIRMPEEAEANLRAFLSLGGQKGELPGQLPGDLTDKQKGSAKRKTILPWVIGGAGVAGAGALLYYALR